jgi:hypothetical protein
MEEKQMEEKSAEEKSPAINSRYWILDIVFVGVAAVVLAGWGFWGNSIMQVYILVPTIVCFVIIMRSIPPVGTVNPQHWIWNMLGVFFTPSVVAVVYLLFAASNSGAILIYLLYVFVPAAFLLFILPAQISLIVRSRTPIRGILLAVAGNSFMVSCVLYFALGVR